MRVLTATLVAATAALAGGSAASAGPGGTQSDASFAASYAAHGVVDVSATTGLVSCYAPEVPYLTALTAADGYPGGGESACPGSRTGEQTSGFATQDVSNAPVLVKDKSESDIRVDPTNAKHLIGQSSGSSAPRATTTCSASTSRRTEARPGRCRGTCPATRAGRTTQTRSAPSTRRGTSTRCSCRTTSSTTSRAATSSTTARTRPTRRSRRKRFRSPCTRPAARTRRPGSRRTTAIRTHIFTAKTDNANTPDKQWIAIDTNPASPHYGRVYAMFTLFIFDPSRLFVSYADARPDGTHTDWSTPQVLPTVAGKPWDTYLLPHVAPDGTVYTTTTNNPVSKG